MPHPVDLQPTMDGTEAVNAATRVTRLGVEAAVGTAVDTKYRVLDFGVSLDPNGVFEDIGPMGYLADTGSALIFEDSQGTYDGKPGYNSLHIPFNSVLGSVVATSPASGAYQRVWTPSVTLVDPHDSYTVGNGDTSEFDIIPGVIFDGFDLSFPRMSAPSLKGNVFGQKYQEQASYGISTAVNQIWHLTVGATGGTYKLAYKGVKSGTIAFDALASAIQTAVRAISTVNGANITVTGTSPNFVLTAAGTFAGQPLPNFTVDDTSATGGTETITIFTGGSYGTFSDLAVQSILPSTITCYLDTTFGGIGGTPMGATGAHAVLMQVDLGITGKYSPQATLNATYGSWVKVATQKPTRTLGFKQERKYLAEGFQILEAARADTTLFFRLEAIGPLITGSTYYKYRHDICFKAGDLGKGSSSSGLYVVDYKVKPIYDPTAGFAEQVTLINTIAD